MYTKFRTFHLIRLLTSFDQQKFPLDVFLRNYFRNHKAIGSHDRKYITETLYFIIRWKGLIDFLCPDATWEKKIEFIQDFEPKNHLEDASIPLEHRVSFPKGFFEFIQSQLGVKAVDFCLASNFPAPTTIRTNTLKTSRESLLERLKASHKVETGRESPLAIHFLKRVNFLALPEFKEGLFEVQDEASQIASLEVGVKPGQQFLDYCAGSGGKSLAIAPQMKGKGQIYLHDIRPKALEEAKKRLYRAGIQNAQIILPNEIETKNLEEKMDWVFVDAPCSGSGTLRRNPDMKWKFSFEEFEQLLSLQKEIFAKALNFVKPKGFIVYATCSVFPKENEEQVNFFIENFPVKIVKPAFSSFPKEGEKDGFYCIVLQKT